MNNNVIWIRHIIIYCLWNSLITEESFSGIDTSSGKGNQIPSTFVQVSILYTLYIRYKKINKFVIGINSYYYLSIQMHFFFVECYSIETFRSPSNLKYIWPLATLKIKLFLNYIQFHLWAEYTCRVSQSEQGILPEKLVLRAYGFGMFLVGRVVP